MIEFFRDTAVGNIVASLTLLSTVIGASFKLLQWRNNRPHLRLEATIGFMPDSLCVNAVNTMALFKAINTGKVEVTVSNIVLILEDSRVMALPGLQSERPIPCRLPPQDRVLLWNTLEGVQEGLREAGYRGVVSATPAVEVASGKRYTAAKVRIRAAD